MRRHACIIFLLLMALLGTAARAEEETWLPGKTVFFGFYEQDGVEENGMEPVEWLILAREGDRALLISRFALDAVPYHDTGKAADWEKSTLRAWLNGEFYNTVFTAGEQEQILKTAVTAEKNPRYPAEPGADTHDKVFLLSLGEALLYFESDEARKCVPTPYATSRGCLASESYYKDGNAACYWWLRTPGHDEYSAALVNGAGSADYTGGRATNRINGVRPAMWVKVPG